MRGQICRICTKSCTIRHNLLWDSTLLVHPGGARVQREAEGAEQVAARTATAAAGTLGGDAVTSGAAGTETTGTSSAAP